MEKLSDRIFETLLTTFILGYVEYKVGNSSTFLLLVGSGTLIAAMIVFVPKINSNAHKLTPRKIPSQNQYIEQPIFPESYQNFMYGFNGY